MNPTGVHVVGTGPSGDAIMRQITIANYTNKTCSLCAERALHENLKKWAF